MVPGRPSARPSSRQRPGRSAGGFATKWHGWGVKRHSRSSGGASRGKNFELDAIIRNATGGRMVGRGPVEIVTDGTGGCRAPSTGD